MTEEAIPAAVLNAHEAEKVEKEVNAILAENPDVAKYGKTQDTAKKERFTSEIFKIRLGNMPKKVGFTEMREFLQRKGVKPHKIKLIPGYRAPACFVNFTSDQEKQDATRLLQGAVLKGNTLEVLAASPAKRPHGDDTPASPGEMSRTMRNKIARRENKKKSAPGGEFADPIEKFAAYYKVPYAEQITRKQETVRKALRKISKDLVGTLDRFGKDRALLKMRKNGQVICEIEDVIESVNHTEGYRNKCEFSVGYDDNDQLVVGFRGSSFKERPNYVIDLDGDTAATLTKCTIPPEMQPCANKFRDCIRGFPEIKAYNELDFSGTWFSITVRFSKNNGSMVAAIQIRDETELPETVLDKIREDMLQVPFLKSLTLKTNKSEARVLFGEQLWQESISGYKFQISPEAFFQVNTAQTELLYEAIGKQLKTVNVDKKNVLLDMCCGVGTIGICLSKGFDKVLGLEIVPEAVENAVKNAELNGIQNAEYLVGKAEETLPAALKEFSSDEWEISAILDPPRNGMERGIIESIRKHSKITRLVYVSCDINSSRVQQNFLNLCRAPSKRVHGDPFKLTKAIPVDMFSHTPHIETIIVFDR